MGQTRRGFLQRTVGTLWGGSHRRFRRAKGGEGQGEMEVRAAKLLPAHDAF